MKPSMLSGLAVGAAAMYFFDPQRGRTRRAHVRDKLIRLEHVSQHSAEITKKDVQNRARGLLVEVKARLRPERVDDHVLVERVRSRIGRFASHPHALEIEAQNGVVTLRGPILTVEHPALLARARLVRGVRQLRDELSVYEQPGGVPGLQGEGRVPALELSEWSPTVRLVAVVAGGSLFMRGIGTRGIVGLALGSVGLAVLLRGLTNLPIGRWLARNLISPEQPMRRGRGEPRERPIESRQATEQTGAPTELLSNTVSPTLGEPSDLTTDRSRIH